MFPIVIERGGAASRERKRQERGSGATAKIVISERRVGFRVCRGERRCKFSHAWAHTIASTSTPTHPPNHTLCFASVPDLGTPPRTPPPPAHEHATASCTVRHSHFNTQRRQHASLTVMPPRIHNARHVHPPTAHTSPLPTALYHSFHTLQHSPSHKLTPTHTYVCNNSKPPCLAARPVGPHPSDERSLCWASGASGRRQ